MSIQRISKDNIENFTLFTYPRRTFASSSSGITGSVLLFARENRIIKDPVPNEDYGVGTFADNSIEEARLNAVYLTGSTDFGGAVSQYMEAVNSASLSQQFSKRLEVTRFIPSVRFTKDTVRS